MVRDAKEVDLFSHHPVFEGADFCEKKTGKGRVIATDKSLDLALLRSNSRLPFLELKERELRIWSWPGWKAWWEAWEDREKGIQAITSSTLSPTPYAAVMTYFWTEDNILRFSFAGHIEGGMSGGPVVSSLNNKIIGVIKVVFHTEGDQEAAERWYRKAPSQSDYCTACPRYGDCSKRPRTKSVP